MAMDINNCSNYTDTEQLVFLAAAIARAISGTISFFASLSVILMIIFFKKYILFTQRLILYLVIAVMLNSLTVAIQGATYFPDVPAADSYCVASGFLNQITNWSIIFAICCIGVDLYFKAVAKKVSRREWIYVLTIFIGPLLFNWIPFIDNAYGKAGPWCWIKQYNDDCTQNMVGFISRLILWYVPVALVLILLILHYFGIYFTVKKQRHRYEGRYNPESERVKKMVQKELQPLFWYPVIFLVIYIFQVIVRTLELGIKEPIYIHILWLLEAIVSPLQGGMISLVYALDKETRKRIKKCDIRLECIRFIKKNNIETYPTPLCPSDSVRKGNTIERSRFNNTMQSVKLQESTTSHTLPNGIKMTNN